MATTIGNLRLLISASAGGLKAGITEAVGYVGQLSTYVNNHLRNSLSGFGGALNSLASGGDPFKMLYNSAKQLVGAVPLVGGFFTAGIGLVEGFIGKLKEVFDHMIDTRKAALKLGTDTKTMSEIMFAAGGDTEAVVKGLTKYTEKLGDATSGNREAGAAFRKLGLDAEHLASLPLKKQLLQITDRFNGLASGAQRAHLAHALFSKGGAEMIPMLSKGRDGIEALIKKANELGLTFNDADAKAALAAKKGLKEFELILKGVWTQIAINVLPIIHELQKELGNIGKGMGTGDAIDTAFSSIAKAGIVADKSWSGLKLTFQAIEYASLAAALSVGTLVRLAAEASAALAPGETPKLDKFVNDMKKTEDEINAIMWRIAQDAANNIDNIFDDDAAMRKVDDFFARVKKARANAAKGAGGGDADLAMFSAIEEALKRLDSMKTPFEKWTEDMQQFRQWLRGGIIDFDQFNKLVGNVTESLLAQQKVAERKAPDLLMRGSAAEYSAILAMDQRAQGKADNDPQKRLADLAEQNKKAAEATAKNTKAIADAVQTGKIWRIIGL